MLSALTRKHWNVCERLWRLLAELEEIAGHHQNVSVYLHLAEEAATKHVIERAVTG